MIICPNFSNPEVAREFEELKLATSEQAAYHIWSLNNGNAIDRAPNGAPSKLFLTLLEHYGGDRVKAILAKAKIYGTSFLNWFGDWMNDPANSSKVVDENGEPLVVWHKSIGENSDFIVFDLSKNEQKEDKAYSPAYHFGTKKAAESVDTYKSKYSIRPFFLSIKNPDTLKDYELSTFRSLLHYFNRHDLRDKSDESAIDRLNTIKNLFEEYGNDGYKYINMIEDPGSLSWAIFDPNKAKSATDNIGIYSTEHNEIDDSKSPLGNIMSAEAEFYDKNKVFSILKSLGEELERKCKNGGE